MIFEEKTRSIPITQSMVKAAYKKVKSNKGGSGVDGESLLDFQKDLQNNLYKIWNRLSSGSYFPPSVKEVEIPKDNGKTRKLGIPTIGDRIAQQVLKSYLEPRLEAIFHEESYGYRPLKSAHQAIESVRMNVRKYAWVIDMDIKNFFDEVDHRLIMKALEVHVEEKWAKMYVQRWLETPIEDAEGRLHTKEGKGTPQGGVISPLLANLYLHYGFDKWFRIHYPKLPFVRYADDAIIHCGTEEEAKQVLHKVRERLKECDLALHPDKTKIVYCKDYRRKLKKKNVQFDFLGFSFRPMSKPSKRGGMFLGYGESVSVSKYQQLIKEIRDTRFHKWSTASISDIAGLLNPKIRGWMHYYETFSKTSLKGVFRNLHNRLIKWVLNRYKRFKGSTRKGAEYLRKVKKSYP